MEPSKPIQVFLRTSDKEVWGPLTVATMQLFIENEAFTGPVELSVDGKRFAMPGEFPELRAYFPQKMWGTSGATQQAPVDMPAEGSFEQYSPIRLYAIAAAKAANGLLRCVLPDREIHVHFRKGNPDVVLSTHPDDSLATFLLRNNLLTGEQLARTEAAKASFGGELMAALFGLGMLNPATAFSQLALHAKGVLLRMLASIHGTFRFEAIELPANKALPLGDRWEVLMEQLRKFPVAVLEKRLQSVREAKPEKTASLVDNERLRLTSHELKAAMYFDSSQALSKILADHSGESEIILRMAFVLREVGALSFGSPPPAPPKPVAVRPASPNPVAAPTAPLSAVAPPKVSPAVVASAAGNEIENLRALKIKHASQNHFQVLGVAPTADASALKAAYFKLAKQFHPDTLTPDAPREVASLKAEIFARVGEAYRMLSDANARAEYEESLQAGSGPQLNMAQVMAAEESFQKASLLVKARKYPEAITLLDEAISANPAEGEFYVWRGFARFLAHKDKSMGKAEAMKDIQKGLSLNERCVAGFYFQGVIARLMGELSQARNHFQRCLQLQPDHLDAQRELRAMK